LLQHFGCLPSEAPQDFLIVLIFHFLNVQLLHHISFSNISYVTTNSRYFGTVYH